MHKRMCKMNQDKTIKDWEGTRRDEEGKGASRGDEEMKDVDA